MTYNCFRFNWKLRSSFLLAMLKLLSVKRSSIKIVICLKKIKKYKIHQKKTFKKLGFSSIRSKNRLSCSYILILSLKTSLFYLFSLSQCYFYSSHANTSHAHLQCTQALHLTLFWINLSHLLNWIFPCDVVRNFKIRLRADISSQTEKKWMH